MTKSSNFPLPLILESEEHGKKALLNAPFVYTDFEKGYHIVVPSGFETDYNSVPRGLWNIMPPWEYAEAGVVHDWLYKNPKGHYGYFGEVKEFNRGQVDDIHKRIMQLSGASWPKRQAMWLGIRAGGWLPWSRYRDALHN